MEPSFTPRSFELLEELEANNEKAWYDEHRQEFDTYLRKPFALVLELATERLEDTELPLAGGAKTMFRQNRDIRFSKNKSPYSTHVSGLLTPSGTKVEKDGVVYLHLDRSGGLIASGFYQLKAAELAPFRDSILDDSDAFSQVLAELKQAGLALRDEKTLKSMPRGYEEHSEHDHADYLKLKSFVTQTPLTKSAWLDEAIVDRIVDYAKSCAPLLEFGRTARAVYAS